MGASAKSPGRVTEQQREFARQFVLLGNASGAYRLAYNAENMSPASIRVEACRLLDNPNVALIVEQYRAAADKAFADVKVAAIARELARIAFVDLRQILDENGAVLPPELWPADVAHAIQAIEVKELYDENGGNIGRVTKIKPASKTAALEMLAKWKRMLIERVEQGVPGDFDAMTDDDLEKELAAEEEAWAALSKASKATKAAVKKAAKKAP